MREGEERAALLRKGRDLAALAASLPPTYAPLSAQDLTRLAKFQRAVAEANVVDKAALLADPAEGPFPFSPPPSPP